LTKKHSQTMKKILFCLAALCLLSQVWGTDRELDSTLLVTKDGLTVEDGSAPVEFKCGTEWSVTFTDNGQTATLRTRDGHWTLTGLSAEVAVAAVSEGAPLVSAVAGSVGVSDDDISDVTSRTLALATTLAQNIGSPTFDAALVAAVATANDVLDDNGIHPIDFNDDILTAITLLGPSGGVIDASDTTVEEVHRDATKTIGSVLNALASSGAISQVPAGGDMAAAAAAAGGDMAAAAAAAGGDMAAAAAAAAAGMDPAALAAAAAAAGGN
jgi:hypothetical protein